MRKVLLAGAALVALTVAGAASAADLPSRRQAPPAYIPPVFTWTGFYVGVNAGYAFNGDSDLKDVSYTQAGALIPNTFYSTNTSDDGSFTGGGQIGYNYQMGSVVFGIEADFNYADLERESYSNNYFTNGIAYDELRAKSKVEWFGTVRPRIGFTPIDRLLVYATGGLAYGQIKSSAVYQNYDTGAYVAGSKDDTRVGWTVGAGAEYAITDNLTVKGEYAYVDLGDKSRNWSDNFGNIVSIKDETNFHIVRAGLNYKF